MKRRAITFLTICTLVLASVPVYADEVPEETETAVEAETEENEEEEENTGGSIADSIRAEAESYGLVGVPEDDLEDNIPEEGYEEDEELMAKPLGVSTSSEYEYEADGIDGKIIEVMNTANSEVNNCQLTVTASLPEGFDANCYAQLLNMRTGTIYNFPLYSKNNFSQRGFIPDGEYRVNEVGVYDDNNGQFKFNKIDDFNLSYGETKGITISLENEQEIIDLIAGRTLSETKNEKEEYEKQFKRSDHEVMHTGDGTGHVSAQGMPSEAYIVVIKVVKGGMPGDISVVVSTDDGQNFSDEIEIPLTGEWVLDDIVYYFEVPAVKNANKTVTYGSFLEGDTYRCVYWNPAEDFEYSTKASGAKIKLHDDDPEKNPFHTALEIGLSEVTVKIEKTGRAGEAIFTYKMNGTGWSDQMYIPKDGIFHIPETTLYIEFCGTADGDEIVDAYFEAEDTFTAKIPEEHIDPLYILIGILVVVLAGGYFAVTIFFKSKIVPQGVYTIHEYEPVRRNSGNKNDKKKKRKG